MPNLWANADSLRALQQIPPLIKSIEQTTNPETLHNLIDSLDELTGYLGTAERDYLDQRMRSAPENSLEALIITLQIAEYYRHNNQHEPAVTNYNKTIQLAKQLNKPLWQAFSSFKYAYYLFRYGDYKAAQRLFAHARSGSTNWEDGRLLTDIYLRSGDAYRENGSYDSAMILYNRCEQIAQNANYKKGQMLVLEKFSDIYRRKGEYGKALEYAYQMLEIAKTFDKGWESSSHTAIANIYENLSDFSNALEHYFLALRLNERYKEPSNVANSLVNIGITYRSMGEYDKALENFEEALVIEKKLRIAWRLSDTYYNIGTAYAGKKDFKKAIAEYDKALKIALENGMDWMLMLIYWEMGNSYIGMKNWAAAKENLQKGLQLSEKTGSKIDKKNFYISFGIFYFEQKSYAKALDFAQKAYTLSNDLKNWEEIMETTRLLSKIYEQQGDFAQAHQFLKLANIAQDSVNNLEQVQRTTRLEMEHKMTKQAFADSLTQAGLNEQIALEGRKNELLQTRNTLYLLLAVVLLALLALGGYLFFQLNRSKKEVELQKNTIETQNQKLSHLNSTKDRMFAIVSHDLRSSVSAFQNLGELINFYLDSNRPELLKKLAKDVDVSAANLGNLLDNLLKWSLTQLDGINLKPEQIPVEPVLNEIVQLFQENAIAKGIELNTDIVDGTEVHVDKNSLHLILRNLVSNAIKFTEKGDSIQVTARNQQGGVLIQVIDTGQGIPPDKLAKLFELGEQKSTRGTAGERGTGLGLSLCKEFALRNQGRLEIESTLGQGTTCSLWLPLEGNG